MVLLGQDFKYAKITWDEALIQNLITIESDFWSNHIVSRNMPDPDGSKACDEVLEQYFKTSRKDSTLPLMGFDGKLKRRAELGKLIEKLEREQKQIDQIIREIDPKRVHEYYEVQEAILESLDQEHKGKFEALIDDLVAWGEEECKAVYIAAFFEGLRLGHKVF